MTSPWILFKQSINLFLANFKYLLKFWLVNISLMILALTPFSAFFIKNPLAMILGFVGILVYILMTFTLSASSLVQAKSILDKKTLNLKELLRQGWKLIGPLFITGLLTTLAVLGGFFLFIIPGLIFSLWFSFTNQVVVMENISGIPALSRSRQLVKGRFWQATWYLVFPGLLLFCLFLVTFRISSFKILYSLISIPFGIISLIYSFLVYKEFAK